MHLNLNDEQSEELRSLLAITLRELSYEIASADLPPFRQTLRHRRDILQQIVEGLDRSLSTTHLGGH